MKRISPQLGLIIKAHRLAASISQEELADRASLHRTYISLLERGRRNPSVDVLKRIADSLGVAASDLVRQAEEADA